MQQQQNNLVLYEISKKRKGLNVYWSDETAWLTQDQLALLFGIDRTVVGRHIRNIFNSKELEEKSVCANYAHTAGDGKTYQVKHYNLDLILSVGYRTNSKEAIRFRKWANERLKEYLLQGYSLNKQLLGDDERMQALRNALEVIRTAEIQFEITDDERSGLDRILRYYAESQLLLTQFDNGTLTRGKVTLPVTRLIEYNEAKKAITNLRMQLEEAGEKADLFGVEREYQFEGILKGIVQTFGGTYLYDSIEEQAAHLLYFVIKDHPFIDGNKRIGALLFVWFLERNSHLRTSSGEQKIDRRTMVALPLLVAASDPSHKNLIIDLVIQLINE